MERKMKRYLCFVCEWKFNEMIYNNEIDCASCCGTYDRYFWCESIANRLQHTYVYVIIFFSKRAVDKYREIRRSISNADMEWYIYDTVCVLFESISSTEKKKRRNSLFCWLITWYDWKKWQLQTEEEINKSEKRHEI